MLMTMTSTESLMPHGACWLWDWHLIALHAPADLLTFLAYSIISLTAIYVYRCGHLSGLSMLHPRLWWLGAAFIGTCGLSHLGSFAEVWFGGALYWITGVNKVIMSLVSLAFALHFWRLREEFSLVGRVLREIRDMEPEKDKRPE